MGTAGSTGPRSGWLKTHPHPEWSPVHIFLWMNQYHYKLQQNLQNERCFILSPGTCPWNEISKIPNIFNRSTRGFSPGEGFLTGFHPSQQLSSFTSGADMVDLVIDIACIYGDGTLAFRSWIRRTFRNVSTPTMLVCSSTQCWTWEAEGWRWRRDTTKPRGSKDDFTLNLVASSV